jgi:RNA polymerase sigma factor (sigma-70 family)
MPSLRTTRVSFMDRLCGPGRDPFVWGEFVATYGPAVYGWCRRYGLQESDAQDVTQEVMVRFWRISEDFRYDPSRRFRAYLRRIVLTAVADWTAARKEARFMTGVPALETLLGNLPAREDLADRIEQAFDMERLPTAMREVETQVKPCTWEAFKMLAIEGVPGKQVAARLGMKLSNVYMARTRVQRLLGAALLSREGAAVPG